MASTFARAAGSLHAALPGWKIAIAGSLFWSAAMAASAVTSLWIGARASSPGSTPIILLFAAGGLLAFLPAVTLARLFRHRNFEVRFAAAFIALTVITVGATAALYALYFRLYFAQWHGDSFSVLWVFQFAFTVAAAIYQFAVLGLRYFFPVGLLALFAASAWLAKGSR